MPTARRILCTILKIAPLALYLRAAACKFEIPALGCDEPLCPVAIGEPAVNGCTPTGNTNEVKAWCEHGWTPWLNGLLAKAGTSALVTCSEESGHQLLKVIGAVEVIGYILLWTAPQFGALYMTVFMSFGLHFHFVFLKDPPGKLTLQLVLFAASFLLLYLENQEAETGSAPVEAPKPVKKKPVEVPKPARDKGKSD